jgi:hypothetical protein
MDHFMITLPSMSDQARCKGITNLTSTNWIIISFHLDGFTE